VGPKNLDVLAPYLVGSFENALFAKPGNELVDVMLIGAPGAS
jgi:hypothetical protein